MIIRIYLIKTLLGKTLVKEKEYNILLNYYKCLVKNLASKTQWDKTWTKEKKSAVYPYYHSPPHINMIMIFFNISNGRSLNLRIPKSYLNFFNAVKGNALLNRSARLLHN